MIVKSNEKIAVHQGFGYISIGRFIGINNESGMGLCYLIKVKPKDDEGCNLGGTILIPFDEFEHDKNLFLLRKEGYHKWLKKIKKEIIKENIYHKWNTYKGKL
jgi:hypothetical protein